MQWTKKRPRERARDKERGEREARGPWLVPGQRTAEEAGSLGFLEEAADSDMELRRSRGQGSVTYV